MTEMTNAARDVLAERQRQVEKEQWSTDHDDTHTGGQLAKAAAVYAWFAASPQLFRDLMTTGGGSISDTPVFKRLWPWDLQWFKPNGRRRELVKSAALILAEIERIDRERSRDQ